MIAECACGQPLMNNMEACPQCHRPNANTTVRATDGVPLWGWLFMVACVAIPVISLGGALPAAIGAGAASACVAISKKPDRSILFRVGACTAITLAAWCLFILLIGGLAWLQQ
jgi:hypothetical protein